MTIRIMITTKDEDYNEDIINQDKGAIKDLVREFEAFLKHNSKPMAYTNEDKKIRIVWYKN
jgi:hypothetical protein